jgi:hypothetical protein
MRLPDYNCLVHQRYRKSFTEWKWKMGQSTINNAANIYAAVPEYLIPTITIQGSTVVPITQENETHQQNLP